MTEQNRKEIVKRNEMRTKEISKMISEGGLGSEKYYDIKKEAPASDFIPTSESTSLDDKV
ncbi:hypothetical protein DV702_04740 [Sporosarcina sp. PTS2304]|uniref:hypothetical protein n=1 Tax=Sporosarcina sp. PTS2304 TaxID=2283194 RepID=UPI000E0D927B|nr:hypothetical protein [Sporosarcina sp. PTS2304]AXH99101.1 hypothetical protein DV702_04740 [Sporosarcina sp. PTS2304]